ncbi:MAG: acyl transferase, partial [Bacteroidetes bacterium]|nr:acyl transferase [Bacteroidota bacterium]
MDFKNKFKNKLFLANEENFEQLAIELFNYQYSANVVYRNYVQYLGLNMADIITVEQIPFLPIEF